jgi:cytoskeletal protein RodZ
VDALEHERYERLPDGLYRRSFLREYAEYLGLNGDLYVVEYDLEHAPPPAPQPPPPRSRSYRDVLAAVPPRALAVGLAVVVVAAGLWWLGGRGGGSVRTPPPTPVSVTPPPTVPTVTAPPKTPPPAAPAVLRLVAATGDCWLSVRVGAANGPVAFEGMLRQGGSMSFGLQRRLLIRLGAPQHLTATIAGRAVADLPRRTADVVVTRAGLVVG